jgi:hypothetical protein
MSNLTTPLIALRKVICHFFSGLPGFEAAFRATPRGSTVISTRPDVYCPLHTDGRPDGFGRLNHYLTSE